MKSIEAILHEYESKVSKLMHEMANEIRASLRANGAVNSAPEFFPLPQRGTDPHFGLGRSTYYDLEKRGMLQLIRVRKPGNIRGKVLVPYAETAAMLSGLEKGIKRAQRSPINVSHTLGAASKTGGR